MTTMDMIFSHSWPHYWLLYCFSQIKMYMHILTIWCLWIHFFLLVFLMYLLDLTLPYFHHIHASGNRLSSTLVNHSLPVCFIYQNKKRDVAPKLWDSLYFPTPTFLREFSIYIAWGNQCFVQKSVWELLPQCRHRQIFIFWGISCSETTW